MGAWATSDLRPLNLPLAMRPEATAHTAEWDEHGLQHAEGAHVPAASRTSHPIPPATCSLDPDKPATPAKPESPLFHNEGHSHTQDFVMLLCGFSDMMVCCSLYRWGRGDLGACGDCGCCVSPAPRLEAHSRLERLEKPCWLRGLPRPPSSWQPLSFYELVAPLRIR